MPTQVQSPPNPPSHSGNVSAPDTVHPHDALQTTGHLPSHHGEALRLALGSILSPKRPPYSGSSSGAASPAHFTRSHSGSSHPSSPVIPEALYHFQHSLPFAHSHPYTPSAYAPSPLGSKPDGPSNPLSCHGPAPLTKSSSSAESRSADPSVDIHAPTPVAPGNVPAVVVSHATTSSQEGSPVHSASSSGAGTPKAHFIETLQGKSAWDALIHGSFS